MQEVKNNVLRGARWSMAHASALFQDDKLSYSPYIFFQRPTRVTTSQKRECRRGGAMSCLPIAPV